MEVLTIIDLVVQVALEAAVVVLILEVILMLVLLWLVKDMLVVQDID